MALPTTASAKGSTGIFSTLLSVMVSNTRNVPGEQKNGFCTILAGTEKIGQPAPAALVRVAASHRAGHQKAQVVVGDRARSPNARARVTIDATLLSLSSCWSLSQSEDARAGSFQCGRIRRIRPGPRGSAQGSEMTTVPVSWRSYETASGLRYRSPPDLDPKATSTPPRQGVLMRFGDLRAFAGPLRDHCQENLDNRVWSLLV